MDINNAFYEIIQRFGEAVGMKDSFAQSIEIMAGAILVIALLCCFVGFRFVRLCSAVMAFFLTAIAICEMLRPTAHMGVIATTFAVVGLLVAFLAYQWYKFSVFFFSALLGYSIAAVFTTNTWMCFGAAIVLGALSIPFHPIVLILSTAVWGGITLGFNGLSYIGIHLQTYQILASVGFATVGMFVQYFMNKNNLKPYTYSGYAKHAAKK